MVLDPAGGGLCCRSVGLGFGVWGLGFDVWGLGLTVPLDAAYAVDGQRPQIVNPKLQSLNSIILEKNMCVFCSLEGTCCVLQAH